MLILAAIVAAVAVWDLTRRLGARRDDPELQEGGLVFGAAAAFLGVLVVVAINPPTVALAEGTITVPLQVAVEWALQQAVTGMLVATAVVVMIEGALLGGERIAEETSLLRYAIHEDDSTGGVDV